MEKGDTSADAAVFAMILLLVNSQDNIISSRTNQISISAEIMVVGSASKVISRHHRRTCTSRKSTPPCTPAQPEEQKKLTKTEIMNCLKQNRNGSSGRN
jgi:hypothetical protein